jgi:hypothetical protein
MTRAWTPLTSLAFTAIALACWLLMFAAGTDIWHDTGRLDLHTLGATPTDVRAFAVAFYGLFFVLLAHLAVTIAGILLARRVTHA